MTQIKAIETRYKGYRFRSRLEARWAVFFDACGLKWEYEKEGFALPSGGYLPDFYIEGVGWIEVKPTIEEGSKEAGRFLEFQSELTRVETAASEEWTYESTFHVLCGSPYPDEHSAHYGNFDLYDVDSFSVWTQCPACMRINLCNWYPCFGASTEAINCLSCDIGPRDGNYTDRVWFHKGLVETELIGFITQSPLLTQAFLVARSARFEHGETPDIRPLATSAANWLLERFRENREWPSHELFTRAGQDGISRMAIFEAKNMLGLPPAKKRTDENGDVAYIWRISDGNTQ